MYTEIASYSHFPNVHPIASSPDNQQDEIVLSDIRHLHNSDVLRPPFAQQIMLDFGTKDSEIKWNCTPF